MKTFGVLLLMCWVNTVTAQNKDFQKIAATLEKHLVGKQFLGGIYDLPCNDISKITISDMGEITISGTEKGCNKTFDVKNASVKLDDPKVKIYQAQPSIDITFYTENAAIVHKAFSDLKKLLNE